VRANRPQLALGCGIVLLSAFECILAYPHLPDPMASNFAGDGGPGGWSSKKSFMVIYMVSTTFWLGALLAAPLLARRKRQNFDDVTRRWLRDTAGWFLLASLAFSAVLTHWVLEANLETGRLSGAFVWFLAAYMGYRGWWTVRLVRRVRRADRQG
jgi:hypothetical protein